MTAILARLRRRLIYATVAWTVSVPQPLGFGAITMPNKTPWGPEHPKYPNCPVAPGTDCTVWLRDGGHYRIDLPEYWRWAHEGNRRVHIVAYTDHSALDQARELLAALVALRDHVSRHVMQWDDAANGSHHHPIWTATADVIDRHKGAS